MKEAAKSTGIQDRIVNLSSVAHGCSYKGGTNFTRSIIRAGILRSYVAGLYKNVVTPVSELMQRSFSSRLRSLGLWTSLLTPFTGLDKISSLALTDKEILGEGDNTKLEIQIKLDKENKILSIRDRGVAQGGSLGDGDKFLWQYRRNPILNSPLTNWFVVFIHRRIMGSPSTDAFPQIQDFGEKGHFKSIRSGAQDLSVVEISSSLKGSSNSTISSEIRVERFQTQLKISRVLTFCIASGKTPECLP
ncbi:hypothetical protein FXO37_25474 [Capsicum annuum]|nr:hypothetical protein FXO37_25474 [Capsicum annuum]